MIDSNKDGTISLHDFKMVFSGKAQNKKCDDIKGIFEEVDEGNYDVVSSDEFVGAMQAYPFEKKHESNGVKEQLIRRHSDG